MKANKGINLVIKEFPIIAEFLAHNDIDCVNCSIGTCRLENVLEVHNFSKDDQVKMYEYMNKLIKSEITEMKRFIPEVTMKKDSLIISMLKEEHIYIMELLYLLDYIITKKEFLVKYREQINQILNYIQIFADECHHVKEENLLFTLFKENEVVKLMLEEHDLGRNYRKIMLTVKDEQIIKEAVKNLSNLLKDHIHKEDEVLFPYLNKMLSEHQTNEIDTYLKLQNKDLQNEVKKYIEVFHSKEFSL